MIGSAKWRAGFDGFDLKVAFARDGRDRWIEETRFLLGRRANAINWPTSKSQLTPFGCRSWSEVDLERAAWTIPPARSKNGEPHQLETSAQLAPPAHPDVMSWIR